MKLVFYGGIDIRNEVPNNLKKIDTDLFQNKSIFVFDLNGPLEEIKTKWWLNLDKYFAQYCANKVIYASDLLDKKENLDLKQFDVVYLGGGDTETQNKYLREFSLNEKLPSFSGVIAGNSAGSLNICAEAIITADDDIPKTKIIEGLGLFADSVEVHYIDGANNEELLELSKERKIYAIPEDSALIIEDGKIEYIGDIWLFEDGIKTKIN